MNNNILPDPPEVHFEAHMSATQDFPFIIHRCITCHKAVFGIHENIELLYFLDGEGFVMYDGTPCPVRKGDIVAVNSYVLHRIMSRGELPLFCLIIDKRFCQYHEIDPSRLVFHRIIQNDGRAAALFQRLITAYDLQTDPFRNAEIKCAVLELLLFLCRHYSTPRSGTQPSAVPSLEHIHRAMGYLKTNLSRKITTDEVAACAGLSKFHFLREFKRVTGCTMTHYLNTLRCEYARNLLETGQYSVKEAACLSGFTNNSYFSSVFRQYTGLRPSQISPAVNDSEGSEV